MLYEMGSRSLEIAPHQPFTPPRASIFIGTMAVTTADREFEVKASYQWPGDTPREEAKSKPRRMGFISDRQRAADQSMSTWARYSCRKFVDGILVCDLGVWRMRIMVICENSAGSNCTFETNRFTSFQISQCQEENHRSH